MLKHSIIDTDEFAKFLEFFKPVFSNPQFRHFGTYITALIVLCQKITASTISRRILNAGHISNITRFLGEAPWSRQQLERLRLLWCHNRMRDHLAGTPDGENVPLHLILDDTNNPKYGKNMDGAGFHYSHTEGKTLWSHCFVTGLAVVKGLAFVTGWCLYRRQQDCDHAWQFRTKIEMACEIIDGFIPPSQTVVRVLTDSWYSSVEVITTAINRRFEMICALKSNRVIRTSSGRLKLSAYARGLSRKAYRLVTVGDVACYVHEVHGRFSKGDFDVRVLICHQNLDDLSEKPLFLAYVHPGNQINAVSVEDIIQSYLIRWRTEVLYRNLKQNLGFNDYQVQGDKAILAHCEFIMIAHGYLEWLRVCQSRLDRPLTLGEMKTGLHRSSISCIIRKICTAYNQGQSVDAIIRQYAA